MDLNMILTGCNSNLIPTKRNKQGKHVFTNLNNKILVYYTVKSTALICRTSNDINKQMSFQPV